MIVDLFSKSIQEPKSKKVPNMTFVYPLFQRNFHVDDKNGRVNISGSGWIRANYRFLAEWFKLKGILLGPEYIDGVNPVSHCGRWTSSDEPPTPHRGQLEWIPGANELLDWFGWPVSDTIRLHLEVNAQRSAPRDPWRWTIGRTEGKIEPGWFLSPQHVPCWS